MLKFSRAQWHEMDRRVGGGQREALLYTHLQQLCTGGAACVSPDALPVEIRAGMRWAERCGLVTTRDTARLIETVCRSFGGFAARSFDSAAKSQLYDRRVPPEQRLTALAAGLSPAADVDPGDRSNARVVHPCPGSTLSPWLEVVLRDAEIGTPAAGEEYLIVLPDGVEVRGYLDAEGYTCISDIALPGACKVLFPNLDEALWDRA